MPYLGKVSEGTGRDCDLFCAGLDGWLARRLGQTSRFGAWLDVVVDNMGRGMLWSQLFKVSTSKLITEHPVILHDMHIRNVLVFYVVFFEMITVI